jgi:hypothetical protein
LVSSRVCFFPLCGFLILRDKIDLPEVVALVNYQVDHVLILRQGVPSLTRDKKVDLVNRLPFPVYVLPCLDLDWFEHRHDKGNLMRLLVLKEADLSDHLLMHHE